MMLCIIKNRLVSMQVVPRDSQTHKVQVLLFNACSTCMFNRLYAEDANMRLYAA